MRQEKLAERLEVDLQELRTKYEPGYEPEEETEAAFFILAAARSREGSEKGREELTCAMQELL